MSYLHSDEGKMESQEGMQILEDSKRVDELLETMQADRSQLHKVIPYLPDQLREDLLSEHFTVECLEFFKDLDKDGNGSLDPEELYPMILALSNAHESSLDISQCRKFASIFDDSK